jgi:hypothetical protein
MAISGVAANLWLPANNVGTSLTRALAQNAAAGSLLVAVSSNTTNETVTFTDNNGNTWNVITSAFHGSMGLRVTAAYAKNVNAGATTVQVSSATSGFRSLSVAEYTGVDTVNALMGTPVSDQASATASNPDPGGVTGSSAGLYIGCGHVYPTDDPTVGTGYTKRLGTNFGGNTYYFVLEDKIAGSPLTNEHPKYNQNEDYWLMLGFAFKDASGSSGGSKRVQDSSLSNGVLLNGLVG